MSDAPVHRFTVEHPSGPFTFCCPQTRLGLQVATEVLRGQAYPHLPFVGDVRTVVDAGANVGAASVYFALLYPAARIVAFEPNPQVFPLLGENVARFGNVEAHDVGLFSRDATLPLHLGDSDSVTSSVGRGGGFSTSGTRDVRLRDAHALLRELRVDRVDVLKLDTEGCEVPILKRLAEGGWLAGARIVYVEYHSEEDRLSLDALCSPTHILALGKTHRPHRGELCYVHRDAFPSAAHRDAARIFLAESA